ncbi:hypothetical protein JVU11DRAFT_1358 [Chiua virens]|nr:hypothetical protein JVU11DRAFT_1358 [Chiua virens]
MHVTRSETDAKSRPQSKLAKLAQAKANSHALVLPVSVSSPKELPKSRTEYLTPIANGATATTAITTSYQSLQTLSTKQTLEPVPLVQMPDTEIRQSKLALKVKKAQAKSPSHSSATDDEGSLPSPPPLFLPSSIRSRALPSAFASLLLNDPLTSPEDKGKGSRSPKYGREELNLVDMYQASLSRSKSTLGHDLERHKRGRENPLTSPDLSVRSASFAFDVPSPDDIVFNARRECIVLILFSPSSTPAAKEREKAHKATTALKKVPQTPSTSGHSTPTSWGMSPLGTPKKASKKGGASSPPSRRSGATTPARTNSGGLDNMLLDLSAANLQPREEEFSRVDEPAPRLAMEREKLLEEARRELQASGQGAKKGISLVVVGHVDAGKSTLMGRLLYELGRVTEKSRHANERESNRAGKSSFSWAWELDGTKEERERGITMDIAMQSLSTEHRQITILDAPGHKDFIPNMISGASQADCALLVVDATTGEFEAGFERGGQTREHLILVRSLGVSQVVVAVNKLDQVSWEQTRYEEVCDQLKAFFAQSGFQSSKTSFVPVGAIGIKDRPWWISLINWSPLCGTIESPLRLPISNVFKGQSSGVGVTGRISGGIVQVGERLRVLPGDETAVVKSIEVDDRNVLWAAAGSNATLYLTAIDPIHLNIGSVLCPPNDLVPLAITFSARVIVFDIQLPITSGASVELFHHSRDVPATISKLVASLDRATGSVTRKNPRVLTKGTSAEIEITLRGDNISGTSALPRPIPIEPFAANKDMGRILLRRGGESIAAEKCGCTVDVFARNAHVFK